MIVWRPGKIRFLWIILIGFFYSNQPGVAAPVKPSLAIQPQDSKIARLYLAMVDRDIETALQSLDLSGRLPADWPKDASGVELNPLPMQSPKSYILRSLDLACALANVDGIPQSKWHRQSDTVSKIIKITDAVMEYFSLDAPKPRFSKPFEPVEYLPYLESMLIVYGLMEKQFPEPERKRLQNWLDRTTDYLWQHPIREQNDRGMAWSALMALAARVSGNDKYLKSTEETLPWLLPLIGDRGEYLDPTGFDLERAAQFLRNLFLYRYYSGRDSLDAKIISGLQWYIRLYTMRGVPLLGISNQPILPYRTRAVQMLGPIAFYSKKEKSFAQTAARYMEKMMDEPPGFALEGGGRSFLLASAFHSIPNALTPLPYTPYFQVYEQSPLSRYVLVGRNYQTAVCLSDPICAKGLQVWSHQGDPPLVFPSPPRYSHIVGFGYDSCRINSLQDNQAVPYKIASVTGNVDVLFVPTRESNIAYIFTNNVTVTIFKQPFEDAILEWIQDRSVCAQPRQLVGTTIQFEGSAASLLLPVDTVPNFEEFDSGNRYRLHFKGEFCWYTFAGSGAQSIIRPIHSGLLFAHIVETDCILNLVINMSPNPFQVRDNFPGTEIPIPKMDPWSVKLVNTR